MSINTYLRCPRRFYLHYIKKLKTRPNIHLLRGSAVHKTLERFFRENVHSHVYYGEIRDAILDIFNEEWKARKDQFLNLKLKGQDLAFFYQESQKMIINWMQDFLKSGGCNGQKPELEKTLFSKKWMLLGRIDAMYNARDPPVLIDYKTCKSIELTDEYKRQMGIYALLYEENYGVRPLTGIHYVKFINGLRTFKMSDTCIKELKQTIIKIRRKIISTDEKDYPCRCGGWCEKDFVP